MGVHRISGFSEDFLVAPHDFSLECLKIKVRHKDRPLCGGHHPNYHFFHVAPYCQTDRRACTKIMNLKRKSIQCRQRKSTYDRAFYIQHTGTFL